MVHHTLTKQMVYQLYACLPFVELAQERTIKMGPVIFWPAAKYKEFVESSNQNDFKTYIESITQVKAKKEENQSWINTIRLSTATMTCISIDEQVVPEQRELLLIDSLYLLYFACAFRNLYYGTDIPSFDVFRKMIPGSLEFMQEKDNWEKLYIKEIQREKTFSLHLFDQDISTAFGKMLMAIYVPQTSHATKAILSQYQRLIRSIRYMVDRLMPRFTNLLNEGLTFSSELFEPEDVIFLTASFEALFDINDRHPNADFKNKLRPLLYLKYSKPVELFWKWVDDFYEARRKIVHGDIIPDPIFRINPNFEVSHIVIGMKLFVYSVYYTLFKYHLIDSEGFDLFTPPDFKWIHPEELLLLFWTEDSLLNKLEMFIRNNRGNTHQEESYADIHFLANLFIAMYERYFEKKQQAEVKFIPTSTKELKKPIQQILEYINQEDPNSALMRHLPPELPIYLMKRLQVKA